MEINTIKKSYINISGKIYDSEFINLANIKNDKIALDQNTLFLTQKEKDDLNAQQIEGVDNVLYIFKYKEAYGIIADIPIHEYDSGRIKCHELVIPDIVQGMISNLYNYNCETAPVLLAHEQHIDYKQYIKEKSYVKKFVIKDIEIYAFIDDKARRILNEFAPVKALFVADGHHRLYTTSLSRFKPSVLACLISFDYLKISPIHRIIPNIDAQMFEKAKEFIYNKFKVSFSNEKELSKGKIRLSYNEECFIVNLIELKSDAFWNNDIYRLNTQIISQAFRIFDTGKLKYVSVEGGGTQNLLIEKNAVLIETYPVSKNEFIECANNKCIMPPKSTWVMPKFPSFLLFKEYQ